jgi:hypothetical protein
LGAYQGENGAITRADPRFRTANPSVCGRNENG